MAQMAATAGSVAIGSTIGHGLSSMLFGGSSSHEAAPVQQAAPIQQQNATGIQCEVQAKGENLPLEIRKFTHKRFVRLYEMSRKG